MTRLSRKPGLRPDMSLAEFDNGYWYATELKAFARKIGIAGSSRLRKDQIEKVIREFLRSGKIKIARPVPGNAKAGPSSAGAKTAAPRDLDLGLRMNLRIVHYVGNRQTKAFIEREAARIAPGLKKKSGARYRLNRWREEQLEQGRPITYGDLVREYVRLNQTAEPFAKIPSGRYINFLAEYLAGEKNATHAAARKAWAELKKLDAPKDYASWKKARRKRK